MTTRLQEIYWEWLAVHVAPGGKEGHYMPLMGALHDRHFTAALVMDENRIQDGRDLRQLFFEEHRHLIQIEDWSRLPVSTLEVLVALSMKLEFHGGQKSGSKWAWELVKNLQLSQCHGHLGPLKHKRIDDALDMLIYRRYDAFGNGSFFPVRHPSQDMRLVDIWYQMQSYLAERT